MIGYRRFAIYFAPRQDDPLHAFGVSWFGGAPNSENAETRGPIPLPEMSAEDHEALIAAPRRYGLHGTLKPPFHLAEDRSVDDLHAACGRLAAGLTPVPALGLEVTSLGRFIALTPRETLPALNDLAARCVKDLDDFRAPPDNAELARRRQHPLSSEQETNLLRWGYPYVLNGFRFHVTLTGPLDDSRRALVLEGLHARLAPVMKSPIGMRDLCLFGDPGDGAPFRLIARYPLG